MHQDLSAKASRENQNAAGFRLVEDAATHFPRRFGVTEMNIRAIELELLTWIIHKL